MAYDILFETNRFDLSEVKDHFMNDCCFGEDLADWLRGKLIEKGLTVTEPGQEDWGWYIEPTGASSKYFVGIGGISDGDINDGNQGEWRIMIEKRVSPLGKLTGKSKMSEADEMAVLIKGILKAESDFKNIHVE
jgi:hypothetical protein